MSRTTVIRRSIALCGAFMVGGPLSACAPQARARVVQPEQGVPPPSPVYDPVPAAAPREEPPWLHADSMLTSDGVGGGMRYTRHVVVLRFYREATPAQRAAAVRAIGGAVVGGLTGLYKPADLPRFERGYVVWVPYGRTIDQLRAAMARAERLPGVAGAFPYYLVPGPGPERRR